MIKPAKLTFHALEWEINKLNIKEKSRLVRRLLQETWKERYRNLLKRIDTHLAKSPLSSKDREEISKIVEEARQEYYNQHAQGRH